MTFNPGNTAVRGNFQNRQDLSPSAVTAAAASFTGSTAEQADGAIRHAANMFAQHLGGIDPARYSDAGLLAQIKGFASTAAMEAATAAKKAVDADVADAAKTVAAQRSALATDADDPAAQTAALRYWQRKKGLLDNLAPGSELVTAAQGLVADANPAELAVLSEELSDYLKSRNVGDTSWIDTAIAKASPELASATADYNAKMKAQNVVAWNHSQLTKRVNETRSPVGYRPPTFSPIPS